MEGETKWIVETTHELVSFIIFSFLPLVGVVECDGHIRRKWPKVNCTSAATGTCWRVQNGVISFIQLVFHFHCNENWLLLLFRAAIRKSPQRRRQPEGGRIDNRWIKMQVLHPIFVQPTPHRSSDRSCSSFNDLTQPITHTTPPCYVFIKRLPADAGPFVHLQNSRRSLVYLTKVPKSETSSFGKWMSGRWLAFHRQLCKLT